MHSIRAFFQKLTFRRRGVWISIGVSGGILGIVILGISSEGSESDQKRNFFHPNDLVSARSVDRKAEPTEITEGIPVTPALCCGRIKVAHSAEGRSSDLKTAPGEKKIVVHRPRPITYYLTGSSDKETLHSEFSAQWLEARVNRPDGPRVELGSRVVAQLSDPDRLKEILADSKLTLARTVQPDVVILQAPDARTALREVRRWGGVPPGCWLVTRLHGVPS
jgi:hypothetical protein